MWSGTTFQFETIIQSHETPVGAGLGEFGFKFETSRTRRRWAAQLYCFFAALALGSRAALACRLKLPGVGVGR